jgi:high affinity Mn2+ porin
VVSKVDVSLTVAAFCMALAPDSFAQQAAPAATPPADPASERFAVHGQLTFVEQLASPFHDPYSGRNSLSPRHGDETFDVTLYLGARLWSGAELWANPEIDQGFGLNNTLGVAGFPSGEAYKVGRSYPYWRVPRLFVRQTVDLGGEAEPL